MTTPDAAAATETHDPRTEPARPDASLGELIGELTSQLGDLVRQELELAKVEAKAEAKRAGTGAGMLAGAAVAALLALVMASFALAWLIDQATNTALAFAIVGVLWIAGAAILAALGRRALASVRPLPQTTTTLKEDAQWARAQKS